MLLGGAVAAALPGCGAARGPGAVPAASGRHLARPGSAGCGSPPSRRAWAVRVTAGGRISWQTPLATHVAAVSSNGPPVLAAGVAVFAQDGQVQGLSLATGRPLWTWRGGQVVDGMWRWGGLVAVLTDQVSDHARITGLDAATGAVRWVLRLPGRGLLGGQAATGGALAMVRADGMLQVVSLADGKVLWGRRAGIWPGVAAAAGVVMFGEKERLTGYAARTGRVLWTRTGLPGQTQVQAMAGLALVTSNGSGSGTSAALVAVRPATGNVAWRFNPGSAVTPLAAGPAGLAAATYVPARRLYLLDPRTGRPRWQADTAVALGTSPLITARSIVSVEGGVVGYPVVRLVSRGTATGRMLWANKLATSPAGTQPVLGLAGQAAVQTAGAKTSGKAPLLAYDLGTGRLAWRALMPTFVQAPPVPIPGGLLLQSADPPYACAVAD